MGERVLFKFLGKFRGRGSVGSAGLRITQWVNDSTQARLAMPLLMGLSSLALFTFNIQSPEFLYFDEERYIPAATQFLTDRMNENWSHPNLGKIMMAMGIHLFGYQPLGWRIMSAVFGVLAVLGTYWLGGALFRNRMAALQCGVVAILNQMLLVQARIAMLDIFMLGFMMPALAAFALVWSGEDTGENSFGGRKKVALLTSGLLFGLAVAAKWIALVPLLVCIGLYICRAGRRGLHQSLFVGATIIFFSGVVYLLSLVPMLGMTHPSYALPVAEGGAATNTYGLLDVLKLQWQMFTVQINYFNPHPYYSSWYTWPLQLRPLWYYRDIWPGGEVQSAIIFLGNPVVLWAGFLGVLDLSWRAVKDRSRAAIFLTAMYWALILCWAVVPRMASLFYYYLPSAMLLGPVLVCVARDRKIPRWLQAIFFAGALACFVYYFPVLTNAVLTNDELKARIWFSNWW
jgi:dolichyl-phosphate-mannose--protein O-mannosyl transferase